MLSKQEKDTSPSKSRDSRLPSTSTAYGVPPTPLTATSPEFPVVSTGLLAASFETLTSPPPSPMADNFPASKGKAKRPVDDAELDPPAAIPISRPSRPLRPPSPQVFRRQHHRRHVVAATVWGPQLPMQGNVPGQRFNIYKALLRHPNLFFQFALRLPPTSLVDLYAIDKEFHFRFNKYSVSIIHEHANYHAPLAAYIFSWIMFPDLCISDPMARPMDGRPHLARDIPSLRWTKMVVHRELIVSNILTLLALEGLRVPRDVHTVLMKLWLLLDMTTMALRVAFLSDRKVWTNQDIILFHLFLVKLDMRFSDPVVGNGACALSHMFLTQKSLTMLHDVLTGKFELDYDEVTDIMIRTYEQQDLDLDTHTWLDNEDDNGVPEQEWGLMCKEGFHVNGNRLEPAVDMIIMEGIERGLHPEQYLLDFVTYGFVEDGDDDGVVRNIPVPRKWRGEKAIRVDAEAWPVESVRKEAIERVDRMAGVEGKEAKVLKTFRLPSRRRGRPDVEIQAVDNTG